MTETIERVVPGITPRVTMHSSTLEESDDSGNFHLNEDMRVASLDEANVVTSQVDLPGESLLKLHAPVIDLDVPHALVPSTTPGHSHLYLDVVIPWSKYVALLDALREAGIVTAGYVSASKARGYTSARLPWIKKKPEVSQPW